jgi:predicted TIM-barrel enzyme
MTYWTKDIFHTTKPIIAMCHLHALPGDPGYDKSSGMKAVIKAAREDLLALQEGGVDGVMFSNEFSLPYLLKVKTETTAAMGRIIGELMSEITVPYGVNFYGTPMRLWTWLPPLMVSSCVRSFRCLRQRFWIVEHNCGE